MRLLLLSLLALSACANIPELREGEFVAETVIRWERGTEPNCGGVRSPAGCATIKPGLCIITMPRDSPDMIVAHEFKHCFGYVHK